MFTVPVERIVAVDARVRGRLRGAIGHAKRSKEEEKRKRERKRGREGRGIIKVVFGAGVLTEHTTITFP